MREEQALGMIECSTLSSGAVVADAMLKRARVQLFFAQPIPPGRLVVAVAGEVAAVDAAVEVGLEAAGERLEDALFIPRLHSNLLDYLVHPGAIDHTGALGTIETATVAAGIRAADAALKTARVVLVGLRLGRHIGGKAVVYLSGDVADVQAAVEAGRAAIRIEELDLDHAVIARPHADLMDYINGGAGTARPLPGIMFSGEPGS
jgi:bacterial microcompartment shell protein